MVGRPLTPDERHAAARPTAGRRTWRSFQRPWHRNCPRWANRSRGSWDARRDRSGRQL